MDANHPSIPQKGKETPKEVPKPTQEAPANTWVTVAKSKAKAKPSAKKLAATGRAFAPPLASTSPGRYDYVYLHQSRRLDRKEIRSRFTSLGIDTSRILDLSFPARSVVGILLHAEYKQEFLAKLNAYKIVPIATFDPLSHDHIIDPKFKDMPATQRVPLAKAIQEDRCTRTLYFVRVYLVPSVAKYFVEQGWMNEAKASAIITDRMPRPTKRPRMNTNTAAAAFLRSVSFEGPSDTNKVTFDLFGNRSMIDPIATNTRLSIGLWNANGLQLTSVADVLSHCRSFDIVLITETWILSPSLLPTSWIQFHTYGKPVAGNYRGSQGIVALVNSDCPVSVTHLTSPNPYTLCLQFGQLRIACFYLPPSLSLDQVLTTLDSIPLSRDTILCGDFNARLSSLVGDSLGNSR
ncbi:hypothetical protein BD560DRAFT_338175, partial [Blakeslea trispora]